MQTILILDASEVFRAEIEKELQKDFQTFSCATPDEAFCYLSEHTPDGLIVNMMLHGMDGLAFLEQMPLPRPRAMIGRAPAFSPYTLQRLTDLGVSFPELSTCSIQNIAHRLRDILQTIEHKACPDQQQIIISYLEAIRLPHWSGYDDVRLGIPIFAQDPNQSMVKEFYPAVAMLRGRPNWKQSERAIRDVKEEAYKVCDRATWETYFPNADKCPTNKAFISRLAELTKTQFEW